MTQPGPGPNLHRFRPPKARAILTARREGVQARRCPIALLDFLDPDKRQQKAIRRAGEKLGSNISTPEARQKAVDYLMELGTEEAIAALLRRFTTRITSSIADREEKEYVLSLLVDIGPGALGPIREYLRRESEIRFPLLAMRELAPPEECVATAVGLLEEMVPPTQSQHSKVLDLLQFLEDYEDPRIPAGVLPLLQEPDDDLRVASATVLGRQEGEEVRLALLEALVAEEESFRVRNAIIDIFVETERGVQGFRRKVEDVLPEGYVVDRKGRIRKRGLDRR